MSETIHLALIGNNITKSLSPRIHQCFAAQTSQTIQYDLLNCHDDAFMQTLGQFRQAKGRGVNITAPFKLEALEAAGNASERALLAGAANTLRFEKDGGVFADNTDGIGLTTDILDNLKWTIRDKRLLILGAGGAVRGILGSLLAEQPQQITLINRTPEKAAELAAAVSHLGKVTHALPADLRQQTFDLIINGTAASWQAQLPDVPASVIANHSFCYDLVYGSRPTVFVEWARSNGCHQAVDGLGMLVEQAAESFACWLGVKPETAAVIRRLRDEIKT
jgi:shikimate dehydrogenase